VEVTDVIRFAESFAAATVSTPVRRVLQILLILGGLMLLAAVSLPWWLGIALPSVARSQGLIYARYERVGYNRFRLHEIEFKRGSVRVTADHSVMPATSLTRSSAIRAMLLSVVKR